jgi:hypothetical protein
MSDIEKTLVVIATAQFDSRLDGSRVFSEVIE